jgi:hypothetical protein
VHDTAASVGAREVGGLGATAAHDVDRALRELLEEERIAQMGGQILLGFLLAVAYTPVVRTADDEERSLYAWSLAVTTTAVVLLLATVPLHRINFGRRLRDPILVIGHVMAVSGLAALGTGIVLSIRLAALFALPAYATALTLGAGVLIVGAWLVVPLLLRLRSRPADRDQPPRTSEGSPSAVVHVR